jgi:hypothetical protein
LFVYFDLFGCDHTMTLSNREPSMLHFWYHWNLWRK